MVVMCSARMLWLYMCVCVCDCVWVWVCVYLCMCVRLNIYRAMSVLGHVSPCVCIVQHPHVHAAMPSHIRCQVHVVEVRRRATRTIGHASRRAMHRRAAWSNGRLRLSRGIQPGSSDRPIYHRRNPVRSFPRPWPVPRGGGLHARGLRGANGRMFGAVAG